MVRTIGVAGTTKYFVDICELSSSTAVVSQPTSQGSRTNQWVTKRRGENTSSKKYFRIRTERVVLLFVWVLAVVRSREDGAR